MTASNSTDVCVVSVPCNVALREAKEIALCSLLVLGVGSILAVVGCFTALFVSAGMWVLA